MLPGMSPLLGDAGYLGALLGTGSGESVLLIVYTAVIGKLPTALDGLAKMQAPSSAASVLSSSNVVLTEGMIFAAQISVTIAPSWSSVESGNREWRRSVR